MKRLIILLVFSIPFLAFGEEQRKSQPVSTALDTVSSSREKKDPPLNQQEPLVVEEKPAKEVSESGKIPVVVDADEIDFQRAIGKVFARGNVKMSQKDTELFCDEGIFDVNTNIAEVKGNVKVIREGTVLYGENVVYNFNSYDAQIADVRFEGSPYYGKSPQGEKIGKDKIILKNGYITTCDLTQPHYRLVAKHVTIYPGDKVIARRVILKVGQVPLFYIPYFSQSLKDKSFPVEVVPGKNDEWGYFMLTRWRYQLNPENKDWLHVDWYENKGWAFGVTHKMESTKLGKAMGKYYALEDKLYQIDKRNSLLEIHGDRSSKADKYLEDDRYKAELSYSHDIDKLSIIAEFHKFSDEFLTKDFFEEEYEKNPSPKTYTLLRYPLEQSSLSLLGQKRANRYEAMSEYLPELTYDFFSQKLGGSKLYFESSDKISNLTKKNANSDLDDDAVRLYSKDVFTYVDKIKWLSISPYAGLNSLYYSKNSFGDASLWRIGFISGSSLSTKVFKVFGGGFNLFGEKIAKLRHVITPEASYGYAHDPTVSNTNVFQFDGVDSLSRSETVSFALRNKLQVRTKQDKKWDFVYFSPALNYTIHPEGADSRLTTITGDLEIYPKEGLSLTADVTYDVDSDGNNLRRISSFNLDFTTKGKYKLFEAGKEVEKEKYSFTYSHLYSRRSDTQGIVDFSYQLTPKVKFENYWRYEFNRGNFFEQQYKLSTDLHCWWFNFGMDVKKASVGGKNYIFWFEFRLKAFPELGITFDEMHEGAKSAYYSYQ